MKREEAINEIKSWAIPSEKGREVLETLIPELAESEDERIRKEIINYILYKADGVSEEQEHSWIAYLEKQKGLDKMIVVSPEVWDKAISDAYENGKKEGEKQKEPHYTKRNALFDKCVENCDPAVMKKVSDEVDEMLEKEQKLAEWSEDWREEDIQTRFAFYTYKNAEDDGVLYLSNVFVEEASRNHGFGTKILRAAEKVAETIGATTICLKVKQDSPANAWYRKNGYGYVAFEDGYDWLEKNLEYMKPNKQEWSEDERIRKYFIWIVKNVLNNIQGLKLSEEQVRELIDNYSGIKESDMLAYLEKQKEQKPEWSDYKDKVNVPYCSSEPEWRRRMRNEQV